MARLFQTVVTHGKFAMLENQASSGRYPKVWDLPCWQKLLGRPNVEQILWAFCAWGMQPSDAPDPQ
eukprot:10846637-Heterocapsa_arctica.AAC.1